MIVIQFRRISDALNDFSGNITGKVALVRVDFNVPMNDEGKITDDTRLKAAVPTVRAVTERGAKVALLSHFGRPKGKPSPTMSLAPVAEAFARVLGAPVMFAKESTGEDVKAALKNAPDGSVLLLENTRFHQGEEKGDAELAKAFADLGDLYVNDAFSAAHRNHASTAVIAKHLPAYAGEAMARELDMLEAALGTPKPPVMAVVGGAKVSTKIDLLKNLVGKVDHLVIGGGMANTFLFADGFEVGASLCEKDLVETVNDIKANAARAGCAIHLPKDVILAKEFKARAENRTASPNDVHSDEMILDAGPKTIASFKERLGKVRTLIWNGPFGAFEMEPFDYATVEAAKLTAQAAKGGHLIAVAGGGDTVAALNHAGVSEDFTFISTAGGAFLEWMEGKQLPGVEALKKTG